MVAAGNPAGPALLSAGALVATSTVLLTEIWGVSRLAFAMAREGDLPVWLGRLAEPQHIPRNAVLASGALLLVLAGVLDLRPALEASSLALLVYYGIMNASALRLPQDRRLYPAAIPWVGLAGCILLTISLSWPTLLAVLGIVLLGLAYYALRHRRHR
jgi:APA family basic amino acid/polyamine antiporter